MNFKHNRTNTSKPSNVSIRHKSTCYHTRQTIVAMAVASTIWGPTALAACDISPKNQYEYIDSVELNGEQFFDGTFIENGETLVLTPAYSGYAYKDFWTVWIDHK
ncbi:hypothetical protein [Thalassotalea fusca]